MVKANKLAVAKKQVEKYKGISIPTEIKESEKHLVHVLFIESHANRSTMEFVHKSRVQIFSVEAFNVSERKSTFPKSGSDQMIVFHDPRGEKERLQKLYVDRSKELSEYSQYVDMNKLTVDTTDEEYSALLTSGKDAKKKAYEAEQKEKEENTLPGADDTIKMIEECKDVESVEVIKAKENHEKYGKSRKTVNAAIKAKIEELSDGGSE